MISVTLFNQLNQTIGFEEVIETYERVLNNTAEFMGTTIIDFSTTGQSLIPDTVEGSSVRDLLWPDDGVPFGAEPTVGVEDQVIVQVEYDYSTNEERMHSRGPSKRMNYFFIFLCIAIMSLVIISAALCICFHRAEEAPVLKVVDETQEGNDDSTKTIRIEMEGEKQYTPHQDAEIYVTGRFSARTPRMRTTDTKLLQNTATILQSMNAINI